MPLVPISADSGTGITVLKICDICRESACAGGAVLGRLWKLLSLAADWPARAAGEERPFDGLRLYEEP
jgi:hypothetical protein